MSRLVPSNQTYTPISTTWSLPQIDSWTVGFDRHWKLLEDLHSSTAKNTYPPYNIIKMSDESYGVEVALAGFSKDEIEIVHHNGILKISGKKDVEILGSFVHKGIATRDFEHQFALADYVEVKSATFENGILSIYLKQELPEEKRPKAIQIQ